MWIVLIAHLRIVSILRRHIQNAKTLSWHWRMVRKEMQKIKCELYNDSMQKRYEKMSDNTTMNTTMFTEDEKVILRNLPEEYRWIARSKDNKIYVYDGLPTRLHNQFGGEISWKCLIAFEHIFKCVTWENSPIFFRGSILDDEEREYLKAALKPFRSQIKAVRKCYSTYHKKEFIHVVMKDDEILFPNFDVGKMYKRMEIGRSYMLEELGITY